MHILKSSRHVQEVRISPFEPGPCEVNWVELVQDFFAENSALDGGSL